MTNYGIGNGGEVQPRRAEGSMGIRCDLNRSACGLVAAAILLSPAFAASQPRLVEVPEDGWDTSAEWQGVDDVEVEVDWPPGLPPGVAAAGVSTLLYCILCEQGYTGAVSITSTIRAQASDWRESTQTVTLSCGEGETSDPDPDPDPDPSEPVPALPSAGVGILVALLALVSGRRSPSVQIPPFLGRKLRG